MCGIAGELWYAVDAPADAIAVHRMAAALAHRGPDGDGLHVDGPLALAHRSPPRATTSAPAATPR